MESKTPVGPPEGEIHTRPIDRVWSTLPFLVPFCDVLLSSMGTVDLAYHLRAGEGIIDSGTIPRIDTYTFSAFGTDWVDQQWGAQVLLAAAHRFGGWATLGVLQAGLVGLSFWLVARACRIRGASPRAATLLAIAGYVVGSPSLSLRPQLLALPLFAVAVLLVADRSRHPARLWFIPILAMIVANLHGSFVLFPLIVGLAWIENAITKAPGGSRRLIAILAMTTLATLVNPYGWDAWLYAYDLSTDPVIRETISEWAPVTLSSFAGWLLVGSAVAVAVFTARRTSVVGWGAIITLVVFFLMAMSSQRATLWWGVVAPVVVAGLLPASKHRAPARTRESPVPAVAIVAVLVIGAFALLPWWRVDTYEAALSQAPQGLTDALQRAYPGGATVFVHQPWGSWLEYAAPEMSVFVDSRIELFSERTWDEYGEVAFAGDDWRDVLDRWAPDAIVADAGWDLLPRLRDDPAWRVTYEDEDGVLFVPT